jgi:DNA-binding XRE family transcriptional regulator
MVKNNFEVDVKVKCIEADMTQAKLGEEVGTTGQYVIGSSRKAIPS